MEIVSAHEQEKMAFLDCEISHRRISPPHALPISSPFRDIQCYQRIHVSRAAAFHRVYSCHRSTIHKFSLIDIDRLPAVRGCSRSHGQEAKFKSRNSAVESVDNRRREPGGTKAFAAFSVGNSSRRWISTRQPTFGVYFTISKSNGRKASDSQQVTVLTCRRWV
jgi:hypothetical protein